MSVWPRAAQLEASRGSINGPTEYGDGVNCADPVAKKVATSNDKEDANGAARMVVKERRHSSTTRGADHYTLFYT